MKRIISIISLLIFSVSLSYANNDNFGKEIVQCFHSTAKYDSIKFGKIPSQKELNGSIGQVNGEVSFKGGFLGKYYYMKFITHIKYENNILKFRIEPTMDTATYPPSKKCKMRNWNNILEKHEKKFYNECLSVTKKIPEKMKKLLGNTTIDEICLVKTKLFLKNFNISYKFTEIDLFISKLAQLKNRTFENQYRTYYNEQTDKMIKEIKLLSKP